MPTYSYRCTECDNAFDIQQAFTDSSLTVCPVCGGKLRKVFGVVGVTFNGPGFYRTDSRSSDSKHGSKHHAKGETKSEAGAAKSDASKSPAPAAAASASSSTTTASSAKKAGSTATK
jgi:putative FmdB family regulatory protein